MKMIKIILYIFMLFNLSIASSTESNDIARSSLEANIVHLPQGDFLKAGSRQFGSLWTRDFCFSGVFCRRFTDLFSESNVTSRDC
jgi:hypothetical protein